MRHYEFWRASLFLAAALAWVGCSETGSPLQNDAASDVSGSNSMQSIDLDAAFGGLAYDDEAEGFGDAQLVAEAKRESDDALTGAGQDTVGHDRRGELQQIWLKIEWGRLDGRPLGDPARDENGFEPIDWSGTASVDTGLIVLQRTLWFETPFDHRLPRTSRRSVGWVSHTGPHKDGIILCILTPPATLRDVEGTLTFATGPVTQSFAFSQLRAGVDLLIESGIEGNAVSIVASADRPRHCRGGFVAGYWQLQRDSEREHGWFRSRFVHQGGQLAGYMAGRFGLNAAGERVFAGKLIGPGGQIRGLVAGHYKWNEDGGGSFEGRWVNRRGTRLGSVAGRFRSGEGGAGHMHGVWAENCSE
jgi:hypothetical protein